MKMIRFSPFYCIATLLLFIIEVLIALYVDDAIIRPYGGDVLVVVLIYCFVKTFLRISVLKAAIIVLLFSYSVEAMQYFNLVSLLGLEQYKLARIVIGTSFAWMDMLAYTIGFVLILLLEWLRGKKVELSAE